MSRYQFVTNFQRPNDNAIFLSGYIGVHKVVSIMQVLLSQQMSHCVDPYNTRSIRVQRISNNFIPNSRCLNKTCLHHIPQGNNTSNSPHDVAKNCCGQTICQESQVSRCSNFKSSNSCNNIHTIRKDQQIDVLVFQLQNYLKMSIKRVDMTTTT